MAKLIKEFENGIIKDTLIFREKEFTVTMQKWENGSRSSIGKGFVAQLEELFLNDENLEEILNYTDSLDFGDEEEIEEALEGLDNLE